jgi:hypothetical protein
MCPAEEALQHNKQLWRDRHLSKTNSYWLRRQLQQRQWLLNMKTPQCPSTCGSFWAHPEWVFFYQQQRLSSEQIFILGLQSEEQMQWLLEFGKVLVMDSTFGTNTDFDDYDAVCSHRIFRHVPPRRPWRSDAWLCQHCTQQLQNMKCGSECAHCNQCYCCARQQGHSLRMRPGSYPCRAAAAGYLVHVLGTTVTTCCWTFEVPQHSIDKSMGLSTAAGSICAYSPAVSAECAAASAQEQASTTCACSSSNPETPQYMFTYRQSLPRCNVLTCRVVVAPRNEASRLQGWLLKQDGNPAVTPPNVNLIAKDHDVVLVSDTVNVLHSHTTKCTALSRCRSIGMA